MFSLFVHAFFTPRVTTRSGTITLEGKGPPVIFSTGLYNTMPRFLYTKLLRDMKRNSTIIGTSGPINKGTISDIADAIGVERVALMSHSSFLPEVLTSSRLCSAVLCDPITLPRVGWDGMLAEEIYNECPVLSIFAKNAFDGADVPVPGFNQPLLGGECTEYIIDNVGHPDILDDWCARLAEWTGLWKGAQRSKTPFLTWKFDEDDGIQNLRNTYRAEVAFKAIQFIIDNGE